MSGETGHADVLVAGAGPAGTAAAIMLARSGRTVTIVEKAVFPRDKICGDALTVAALRLLEQLGLDPAAIASWRRVDDVVVRAPSGREVAFPLPRGQGTYVAVARRLQLDSALADLAREAGAKLLDGHACSDVIEHEDRVEIAADGLGTLQAEWLVAADGMWSPVRKHLGLATPGYLGDYHAFRQYFTDVGPKAAASLYVWFEPDLLRGYVWSFPLAGGCANVGFGIQRGGIGPDPRNMAAIWRTLLDRPHIRAVLGDTARAESPHRAWPIPARLDQIPLTGRRTLLAGDATAAVDPMTGEGIAQALLTGKLAANAIICGTDAMPAETTLSYEQSVQRMLMPDHRMSKWLARMLSYRSSVDAGIQLAGMSAWTRRHFARWLIEDCPRAIAATPQRWRRQTLRQPGAFDPD